MNRVQLIRTSVGTYKLSMPTLYKGAGPGTHRWSNDPRKTGLFSSPLTGATHSAVVRHITAYSHPSPFVSCSASFAVAAAYARIGPLGVATEARPGIVYEIDTDTGSPDGLALHDPLELIIRGQPEVATTRLPRCHDGGQDLILGVASPSLHGAVLSTPPLRCGGGLPQGPMVTPELSALINALRDAEILACHIPANFVVNAHPVW